MPSDNLHTEARAAARKRVEEIKALYIHLFVYALVIALLSLLNVLYGDGWWVQWVLLGWGIGVLAHAFAVIGLAGWEQRKAEEIARRLEAKALEARDGARAGAGGSAERPGEGPLRRGD